MKLVLKHWQRREIDAAGQGAKEARDRDDAKNEASSPWREGRIWRRESSWDLLRVLLPVRLTWACWGGRHLVSVCVSSVFVIRVAGCPCLPVVSVHHCLVQVVLTPALKTNGIRSALVIVI